MPHLRFRVADELALIDLQPGMLIEIIVDDVAIDDDGATLTVRLAPPMRYIEIKKAGNG